MKLKQYIILIVSFLWLFPTFGQLPEVRLLLLELPLATMADTLRKEGYSVVAKDSVIEAAGDSGFLTVDYAWNAICRARYRIIVGQKNDAQALWNVWLDFALQNGWVPTEFYEDRQEKRCRATKNGLSMVAQTRLVAGNWEVHLACYWVNRCPLWMLDEIPGRTGCCWEED